MSAFLACPKAGNAYIAGALPVRHTSSVASWHSICGFAIEVMREC